MSTAFEKNLSARELTEHLRGRWSGSSGSARCPAHEDRHPSLSLSDGADGKLLLYCHTGCRFEDIVAALRSQGLLTERQTRNLGRMRFAANRPPPRPVQAAPPTSPPRPRDDEPPLKVVDHYDYADEHGTVLFQSIRFEPKRFKQRKILGDGRWEWNLDGVRLVLYRLPELLAAPADQTVYIPEGEKDVDRLRSLGLVATCNPMGAAKKGPSKWKEEFSPFLLGRNVVILPDNDEAGQRHAQQIAESVRPFAASVRIVTLGGLQTKGDVSDWFDAGHTLEEFHQLTRAEAAEVAGGSRLVAVSSSDLLLGDAPPVPWLVAAPADADGVIKGGLLADRETAIIGAASGTGKTWLMAEIVRTLAQGDPLFDYFPVSRPCRVMLVDEESSLWLLRQRWALLLQGHNIDREWFARHVFDERIKLFVDQGFSFDDDRAYDSLLEAASLFRPDVVMFDTLARVHRRPENDNSQIAALFEDRIKPFRREIGCSLIFAHHVRKPAKDAPNDPGSLLRGASDLKGQLDQFWFLRGRSGDPRSIFEHDKCRAMPELPSFVLARETMPNGGLRLTRAGEAVSASAAAADVNKEVILRFLIDNGQQSREEIFEFGKTRGMGERTVASTLSALLETEDVDRARIGHKAMYWAVEMA